MTYWKPLALVATAGVLAGCVEIGMENDGLSGTQSQFDAMRAPCISQASRLTGASTGSIFVVDEIRTGGGPILTLSANGQSLTCRLESNGTVTVFSEFAN